MHTRWGRPVYSCQRLHTPDLICIQLHESNQLWQRCEHIPRFPTITCSPSSVSFVIYSWSAPRGGLYTYSTGHTRPTFMIYCLWDSLLLHLKAHTSSGHTSGSVLYITITLHSHAPKEEGARWIWRFLHFVSSSTTVRTSMTPFIVLFYHPLGPILTVTVTSDRVVHLFSVWG